MVTNSLGWSTPLFIKPIQFGSFADADPSPVLNSWAMYNSEYASYAFQASNFSWGVYNFSKNGHFTSTIESANLSFTIRVGCDTTQRGCSLFGKFASNAQIFSTGNDLLNNVCSSGNQSVLNGYLINTFWLCTTKTTKAFWNLQLQIVTQLRLIHATSVVVAIVTLDIDRSATRKFASGLERAHRVVSRHVVRYADIGYSVDDSCVILTAIQTSCALMVEPIKLIMPPKPEPKPLGAYIHKQFNCSQ